MSPTSLADLVRGLDIASIVSGLTKFSSLTEGDFKIANGSPDAAVIGHDYAVGIAFNEDGDITVRNGFVDAVIFAPKPAFARMDVLGGGANKGLLILPTTEPVVLPALVHDDARRLLPRDFVSRDLRAPIVDMVETVSTMCDIEEDIIINAVMRHVAGAPMGKSGETAFQRVFSREVVTTVSMHVDDIRALIDQGALTFELAF